MALIHRGNGRRTYRAGHLGVRGRGQAVDFDNHWPTTLTAVTHLELQTPDGTVETYLTAAVVYFVICFSLSMLVRRLQKKIQIIR